MADFNPRELKDVRDLVVVVSTYGEGDPPDRALGFYEFLFSRKAPRLADTRFAVLGLGDSTYQHFCKTGKDFDARLEALGARRLLARQDCDIDYEDTASAWLNAAVSAFADRAVGAVPATVPAQPRTAKETGGVPDLAHPFFAPVLETVRLTGRGSDKETRHIELSLEESGIVFQPGDSLAVVPNNDPALVTELIETLDLDPALPVTDKAGAEVTLSHLLLHSREITVATPRFAALYAEAAGAKDLQSLAKPDNRDQLAAYFKNRQIADIVREHPARNLDGAAFANMLRKLQPRLYSLASSPMVYPDEAHVMVALVRFGDRRGVASAYLNERLGVDDKVPVYLAPNKHFRLPEDGARPVIMVGAGTGVAPFRAFLQHREAVRASGRNWLFFGEQSFRNDFLYQVEWQRLVKTGLLSRMDVAFSRDQSEKVYVQHRLAERGAEIFAWLEEGAHFYVCGDASGLAPGVERALLHIIESHGGLNAEQAREYLAGLRAERRYQRDVY